ncbi:MAG: FeoB-associated Cys-rich membrane protein [Eubacteriales bacterium]|nr:FeoB-associated Cys-rich membrane protein [Eubacteriales bacterium]
MTNVIFENVLSAMHPVAIVTIIAAVAIVGGVIIASIVRKVKGKPSLGSDCAGCSHAGQCNGHCCSDKNVDWTELVKQRKAELEAQREKEAQHDKDTDATNQ